MAAVYRVLEPTGNFVPVAVEDRAKMSGQLNAM